MNKKVYTGDQSEQLSYPQHHRCHHPHRRRHRRPHHPQLRPPLTASKISKRNCLDVY
jgi:hypothetical protein